MTIAHHTGSGEPRPCDRCGTVLPHRQIVTLFSGTDKSVWRAEPHAAPCGQCCFGGGAKMGLRPFVQMHGYNDRCPKCGSLRVLPEVVAEMRERAQADIVLAERCSSGLWRVFRGGTEWSIVRDTDGVEEIARVHIRINQCDYDGELFNKGLPDENAQLMARSREIAPRCAGDLLRALTEIESLTAERDEARQALDAAQEQNLALQMRVDDVEITVEEAKGEVDVEEQCTWNPISPSSHHEDDL
jgi:hypothetical protein